VNRHANFSIAVNFGQELGSSKIVISCMMKHCIKIQRGPILSFPLLVHAKIDLGIDDQTDEGLAVSSQIRS
jgi:hypothetical protein